MIAKVIVWDESRPRAIMKMITTLKDTVIFGVKTNIPFLLDMLQHPEYVEGTLTTGFIRSHFPNGARPDTLTEKEKLFLEKALQTADKASVNTAAVEMPSPWNQTWRNV